MECHEDQTPDHRADRRRRARPGHGRRVHPEPRLDGEGRCPVSSRHRRSARTSSTVARLEAPEVRPRAVPSIDCAVYEPHACSLLDSVPAMSPIGGPHLVRYTTSTHDQRAYLTKDSELIGRMLEVRITQALPHSLAALPLRVQLQVGLMHELGGVEGVALRLGPDVSAGQPP